MPISDELAAFGRTEAFFNKTKSLAIGLRQSLGTLMYHQEGVSGASIEELRTRLSNEINEVLRALGAVNVQPTGPLPFSHIASLLYDAGVSAGKLHAVLLESEREYEAKAKSAEEGQQVSRTDRNPFRDMRHRLGSLSSKLEQTHEAVKHAAAIAGSALMILKGAAGTGKTHLLCDAALHRLDGNHPTLLLMGQRFLGTAEPWTQAFQQLDLPGITVEEVVGCIESAAQAAQQRALVIVDAINEGAGRQIWPVHLPAFLAALHRSPWISVLLSVRSSYEEIVIPEEVRHAAVSVTHWGFADREYDATRTFFVYYGLELPSTPLLAPEFRNPLFLKSLCSGLHARRERRLPRGFQGISFVLDLYLQAVNDRLARTLDFNPKAALPRRALEALAKEIAGSGQRWLPAAKAAEVIDALLPNRGFEHSLYHGLVTEGVLIEEAGWPDGPEREIVVVVSYDRFADHLITRALLDQHLVPGRPTAAFASDAGLGFLSDTEQYIAPGLLEALCIQIPERTGQEFMTLAPKVAERRHTGAAFRQSLIWRDTSAFSQETWEVLRRLDHSRYDLHETLEVLLTVATIPGHPFNANFLDRRLRDEGMADRDAWWRPYLHSARGERGAVDRLVDWAWAVKPADQLDTEAVDLCATALSWTFTTSNRYLRDRATKAVVSLLTGRIDSTIGLVERFADVDDPYVCERVYAVAYGIAMRSYDTDRVGRLATVVYQRVFASGRPPPQILLRDYARGVVERALWLGANVLIQVDLVHPPYGSDWPEIPTEEQLKPLQADWSRGDYDSGQTEWARNSIGSSVMSGDFARYVIGTNHSISDWLSVRLGEPAWRSPEQRIATLLPKLSAEERAAWDEVEAAEETVNSVRMGQWLAAVSALSAAGASRSEADTDASTDADVDGDADPEVATEAEADGGGDGEVALAAIQQREQALEALRTALTPKHADELDPILRAMRSNRRQQPPYFDLSIIQRYVLWRVFDLGWTTERFGEFDRFQVGNDGREATKAERIGKKYQWIAYHEIMALVADHFQYREQFRDENGDQAYYGPWQASLRDIDPSCTLHATPGGTSWGGHSTAWWGAPRFENWDDASDREQWVARTDNLPSVEELLKVTNPSDGSCWLNLDGYFSWDKSPPADQERYEIERRGIWYICTGYLVRQEDADAFMSWAREVDFFGRWMPAPPKLYRMFLGEHAWSTVARYFGHAYYGDPGWAKPPRNCPVKVRTFATEYLCEGKGVDCSMDEGFTLRLPDGAFIRDAKLRWAGEAADYVDPSNKLAVTDPTAHDDGPSALLVREDVLNEYLAREGLAVCWSVLGEKQVIGPGYSVSYRALLRISGAYRIDATRLSGFLKYTPEGRFADSGAS